MGGLFYLGGLLLTCTTAVTWYPIDIKVQENIDTPVRWKSGELNTTARRP